MGTYTTNYNLYMPTIGEQGWGDLMNGNLTTIDTTMAGLNTRLTAVENEVNGNLSCTSVTTSGTITSAGKITANGGIGTKALTATSISNSGNMTNTGTLTSTGKITANGGLDTKALTATSGTINGDLTVTGNIIGSVDIGNSMTINQGSILGGLYFDHTVTWLHVINTTNSATRTYRANPLCNTVQLSIVCDQTYFGSDFKMTVNGETILSAPGTVTRTLNDGDVLYATGKTWSNVDMTAKIRCYGWLVNA